VEEESVMKTQRFVAPTKREAIEAVRRYLGSEAVILSDRRTPAGIELTASTDGEAIARSAEAATPEPNSSPTESVTSAPGLPGPAEQRLERSIQSLRELVEDQMGALLWKDSLRTQPYRGDLVRRLLSFGLSLPMCNVLADAAADESDVTVAWRKAIGHLISKLSVGGADLLDKGGVAALVGPTGVGKTTTVAKLAGQFLMRHGPGSVALVTTDDYRLGAQEQLLAFARILDIPVLQARDQNELESCIQSLRACSLVLIDTEGLKIARGPGNPGAPSFDYSRVASVYLLLSSGALPSVLAAAMSAVRHEKLRGCVITKVDECASVGGVLGHVVRHRTPLSFLTDGQQVPTDLHPAEIKQLLELADTHIDPDGDITVDDRLLAASFAQIETLS